MISHVTYYELCSNIDTKSLDRINKLINQDQICDLVTATTSASIGIRNSIQKAVKSDVIDKILNIWEVTDFKGNQPLM